MIPINNSDTAWLIVSDYLQDNDYCYEDLREDILNPEINEWCSVNLFSYPDVGGAVGHSREVGCDLYTYRLGYVGGFDCNFDYFRVGGASNGVGGNGPN